MSRVAAHPILPLFLERHSPRAMSGAAIDAPTLHRLFEAARWAPSSSNQQPWRLVHAIAGTPEFGHFLEVLAPFNQTWCAKAGALVVVAAKVVNEKGEKNRSAAFDTGAAWMSLALQGQVEKLVVHAMGGFDMARARALVGATDDVEICAVVAIGHPGDVAALPEPLRAREAPNDRRPQEEWVFAGAFPKATT